MDTLCIRGIMSEGRCQLQLTNKHSSTSPLRIMLQTSCRQFDNEGYSSVNVKLKLPVFGQNNPFWQHYTFPQIKVCYKQCLNDYFPPSFG